MYNSKVYNFKEEIMLYLKRLRLVNYCNFTDHTFDFVKSDGSFYKYVCFYGPNGIGKSSALEAISKLTMNTTGRSSDHVKNALQKYVRNTDYNPQYQKIKGHSYAGGWIQQSEEQVGDEMLIEGVYELDGKEYIMQLTQNGFVRNDFAPLDSINSGPWGESHLSHRQRIAHYITSDSDLSLNKIQVHKSQIENFEGIISEVMRYKAECIEPSGTNKYERDYATDVIINKGDFKIHFKRMSAGERKICKSFSEILNLMNNLENPAPHEEAMPGWPRLLLIDNIVMHVYYDRHVTMVDCLKNIFSEQQIFATTHSGILITRFLEDKHDQENELYIDLEKING